MQRLAAFFLGWKWCRVDTGGVSVVSLTSDGADVSPILINPAVYKGCVTTTPVSLFSSVLRMLSDRVLASEHCQKAGDLHIIL